MNICTVCNIRNIERRNLYCFTCYVRLLRNGKISKLDKIITPDSFSLEQREIIIGSLLGDGCIFKYKLTHKPYFCIVRSAADDQYLIWEYEKFKNFCISPPKYKTTFDERTNKEYFSIKFSTCRIDLLNKYYDLWYPNDIKTIPQNIELSPLTLAIWFCDDGNISPANSPWRMHLKLSTHGFDYASVEILQSLLQNRYNEKFSIIYNKDKLYPIIYASDNATRAFISEIDPIFPNSMIRKAYWKKPEAQFYNNQPKRSNIWSQNEP